MIESMPLQDMALGDVVTLADGRHLSIRSIVGLTVPVDSMTGFVLLGELEMLVGIPPSRADLLTIYLPVETFPYPASTVRSAAEGAARFWAPHLPAVAGAMGEILYRVMQVQGSLDPIVLIYRGPETVVFVRTGQMTSDALKILRMDRPLSEQDVDRHAATLSPALLPTPAIEHAYETLTRVR